VKKAGIALFVVVAILLFAAAGWMLVRRLTARAIESVTAPAEEQINLGAVVTQVRELSRLETASMRVMHVGTVRQTYRMVPDAIGGDELTFLAMGDVIAGIDLSQLGDRDVWREGDTVVMRLPPPQILISRVDNKESRVLSRKTGMLRRADVDLETRARQFAEKNITDEAVKKGVLTMASQNAERKLAEFLRQLGAKQVRFVSSPPPRPAL
jgi:hypothetical protein